MQTAKPKAATKQKELKAPNQTRISEFFSKPNVEPISQSSNQQELEERAIDGAVAPELSNAEVQPSSPFPEPIKTAQEERDVIVIEDSPIKSATDESKEEIPKALLSINGSNGMTSKPSGRPQSDKTVHPFFSKRAKQETSPIRATSMIESRPLAYSEESPSWPTSDTMHCGFVSWYNQERPTNFGRQRGSSQTSGRDASGSLFERDPDEVISSLIDLSSSYTTLPDKQELQNNDAQAVLGTIPNDHRVLPALSRLLSSTEPPFLPHRTWNDKYGPRRAEEMLQNAERSVYLRKWLSALEVQVGGVEPEQASRGVKRPRPAIQRDVGRKRGRKRQKVSDDPFDNLDDFIAEDDDDEETVEEDDEDERYSIGDDLPRVSTVSSPISSRHVSPLPPPLIIPRGTKSRPSARQIIESSPPSSPASAPAEPSDLKPRERVVADQELVPLTERLTNTILLTGPCGSGKTAAVFACAAELNWKVFEFYPGIGKRSGAGFMSEVGGAGENHRVGGIERDIGSRKPSQTLGFMTSPSKKARLAELPSSKHEIEQVDVRQSLILVEEADILYQSDSNFWPTLINFIRKSRRPVILTCNDVALIPVEDIPLQTSLEFESCDVEVATSYLQAISLAEGRPLEREAAKDIYTNRGLYVPMGPDVPDQPLLPVPSERPPNIPDLKRAINHLQFQLAISGVVHEDEPRRLEGYGDWSLPQSVLPERRVEEPATSNERTSRGEDLETILQLGEMLDAISFSEAQVGRPAQIVLELESIDRLGPSPDDVMGHTLLRKSQRSEEAFGVAFSPRDEAMAVDVAYHARLQLEQRGYGEIARRELVPRTATSPSTGVGWRGGFDTMPLALSRRAYQGRIVQALDEKIVLSSVLLPRPGCVLDYIPWMQEMARGAHEDAMWRWMSAEGERVLLTERLVSPQDGWL